MERQIGQRQTQTGRLFGGDHRVKYFPRCLNSARFTLSGVPYTRPLDQHRSRRSEEKEHRPIKRRVIWKRDQAEFLKKMGPDRSTDETWDLDNCNSNKLVRLPRIHLAASCSRWVVAIKLALLWLNNHPTQVTSNFRPRSHILRQACTVQND